MTENKRINYFKGRGEHCVFDLENMVIERNEFIKDLKIELSRLEGMRQRYLDSLGCSEVIITIED